MVTSQQMGQLREREGIYIMSIRSHDTLVMLSKLEATVITNNPLKEQNWENRFSISTGKDLQRCFNYLFTTLEDPTVGL